jgi:tetratricopeptide (TPR) repeat protein/TolB-like protein/predicted Ser/Thr protein kinase
MMANEESGHIDETQSFSVLNPGTRVSQFKVIKKIGSGGMAEAYLAEDTRLQRKVTLKFLLEQYASEPEIKARFTQEAQAAAKLNHPNIITIHEVAEFEGRPYIAMEYLPGGTLKDLMAARELTLREIIDIGIQVGEGLNRAHEDGIVHRDIKPQNLLLAKDGRVKVADFGLAKVKGGSKITTGGSTFGTMAYMSPEQTRGEDVDRRSDIFSFGVVLYEMITRHQPFKGDNAAAIINSILNETPEPLARYKAGVPEGLERLVEKALEKDRADRYQHMDDMVADLRRMKKSLEFTDSGRVFAQGRAPGRRRKVLTFLVPAAVVCALILIFFVFEPFRVEMGPKTQAMATENSLAIMYFDNLSDPGDSNKYSKMITSLLITDLSGSDYLQVVSRQRLYDILKLMGREGSTAIDRSVATEVAEMAGAKWILTGDILQSEPAIVITSEISVAQTGEILATHRIDGGPGEDLFSVVDRLSAEIKGSLSLPEHATVEIDRPVAEVTTHSADAYRYYLEGLEYAERLYWADAEASFRKAIESDSTFAMAYYRLATVTTGPRRRELAKKAVKYSDRTTEREKLYIDQFLAVTEGRYEDAMDILEKLIRKYPEEKEAYMALAGYYRSIRADSEKAVELYTKAIEIDPLYKMVYNMLAYTYDDLGNVEKMVWAINKYVELAPDEPNPYDSRGDLLARNGKLDQAIESYKRAVEIKPDFYYSVEKLGHMYVFKGEYEKAAEYYSRLSSSNTQDWRAAGRKDISLIFMHQGKLQKALETIDAAITADRMEQAGKTKYEGKFFLKSRIYMEKGEIDRAIAEHEKAMAIVRENNPENVAWGRDFYVMLLMMAGRTEEALAVYRELDEDLRKAGELYEPSRDAARALLKYGGGDADSAAVLMDQAFSRVEGSRKMADFHTRYFLAIVYLDAGRLSEAVHELEQMLGSYGEARAGVPIWSVKSHYLLGKAYEMSGWHDKAIEEYSTFLDIWKEADSDIPVLNEARERLANLKRIS